MQTGVESCSAPVLNLSPYVQRLDNRVASLPLQSGCRIFRPHRLAPSWMRRRCLRWSDAQSTTARPVLNRRGRNNRCVTCAMQRERGNPLCPLLACLWLPVPIWRSPCVPLLGPFRCFFLWTLWTHAVPPMPRPPALAIPAMGGASIRAPHKATLPTREAQPVALTCRFCVPAPLANPVRSVSAYGRQRGACNHAASIPPLSHPTATVGVLV